MIIFLLGRFQHMIDKRGDYKNTSTFVGHFELSPTRREKRHRRVSIGEKR